MDFFKLLRSLDELLYEIISWLIFYPVTLWRSVRHPWRMMDYADTELGDADERQYADTINPPLFLIITLLLSHAIELALVGESPIIKNTTGLAALIDDDTNLVMIRAFAFGIFPLAMAVRLVRAQGTALDRETLRPPFYSQCYVTAPFALTLGLAAIVWQIDWYPAPLIGFAMMVGALLWYGSLQIGWFAEHLKASRWRGFGHASIAMVQALLGSAFAMALFV